MADAGGKLYQLQYLLLEAQLPPDTAAAWQHLLVRLAEALLTGSTPPAAVPMLATALQQGLRRQGAEELTAVSERDKVGAADVAALYCLMLWPPPFSMRCTKATARRLCCGQRYPRTLSATCMPDF